MKKKQFLWLMIAIGMLSAGSGCDTVKPVSTTQEIPTAEETNLVTTAPISEGEQPAETTTVPQIADVLTTAATTPTTTGEEYEDTSFVELLMERMTLEQKVCQMFIVTPESLTGYNGAVTEAGALSKESFTAYPVGGLIYFSDNLEDAPQTVSMLSTMQDYAQETTGVGLFLSVDEEGGTVVRVSKYPAFRDTPFLSPQELYAQGEWDGVYQETIEKGNLLKSLGINLCLAPVADISNNPNDYIYERTFGGSAEDTSQFIEISTKAYRETNIGCTLKHFPGYASNLNTHNGSSVDNREQSQFYGNDLKPFQAGIDAGAPVVMVNHNIVSCFDAENPASISPEVHSVLRKDLHFSGLICTDSLDMGATKNITDVYLKAVDAGNDLIATCETAGYPIVLQAVHTGRISENRVNESVIRILAYKLYYGLMS